MASVIWSLSETWKSAAALERTKTRTKKSKASRVQPRKLAITAFEASLRDFKTGSIPTRLQSARANGKTMNFYVCGEIPEHKLK